MDRTSRVAAFFVTTTLLLAGCFDRSSENSPEPEPAPNPLSTLTIVLSEKGVRGPVTVSMGGEERILSPGESIEIENKGQTTDVEWEISASHAMQVCFPAKDQSTVAKTNVVTVMCEDKVWFRAGRNWFAGTGTAGWYLTDGTPEGTELITRNRTPVRDTFYRPIYHDDKRLLSGPEDDAGKTGYWLFDAQEGTQHELTLNPRSIRGTSSDGNNLYFLSEDADGVVVNTVVAGSMTPSHFLRLPVLPEGDSYSEAFVLEPRLFILIRSETVEGEVEASYAYASVHLDAPSEPEGRFIIGDTSQYLQRASDGEEYIFTWREIAGSSKAELLMVSGRSSLPLSFLLPVENIQRINPLGFTQDQLLVGIDYGVDDSVGGTSCSALYKHPLAGGSWEKVRDSCQSERGPTLELYTQQLAGGTIYVLGRTKEDDPVPDTPVLARIADLNLPEQVEVLPLDSVEGRPFDFQIVDDWLFLFTLESWLSQPYAPWYSGYTARAYSVDLKDLSVTELAEGSIMASLLGPAARFSSPASIANRVLFPMMDNQSEFGQEPWVTDGTSSGTGLLIDTNPGVASGLDLMPSPGLFP
jgi:ELWxxDGT repeat protein